MVNGSSLMTSLNNVVFYFHEFGCDRFALRNASSLESNEIKRFCDWISRPDGWLTSIRMFIIL